jgi:hypothetical protein
MFNISNPGLINMLRDLTVLEQVLPIIEEEIEHLDLEELEELANDEIYPMETLQKTKDTISNIKYNLTPYLN